jgi:hypothetical protein
MLGPDDVSLDSARGQLQEKLQRVTEQLRQEMSARGFDPAQAEHLALTGPLAKLYMEQAELREELNRLSDEEGLNGERDVS